jgi:hypothetical protein
MHGFMLKCGPIAAKARPAINPSDRSHGAERPGRRIRMSSTARLDKIAALIDQPLSQILSSQMPT